MLEKREGDLKAEAYIRYLAIATDPSQPAMTRMKAQERIDKLLGLEGPLKVEVRQTKRRADPATIARNARRLAEYLGIEPPPDSDCGPVEATMSEG